ncbi:hypothetical protein K438DRAFT_1930247 [Mycena galopus ATCC 62051]|nr:hypothetical protein K438DRAFT_1930247 [Mycena galopus ATCC 62051]
MSRAPHPPDCICSNCHPSSKLFLCGHNGRIILPQPPNPPQSPTMGARYAPPGPQSTAPGEYRLRHQHKPPPPMPPMPRGYGEPLNPNTSRRSMDQRTMNSINEFGFLDPMGPDTHLYHNGRIILPQPPNPPQSPTMGAWYAPPRPQSTAPGEYRLRHHHEPPPPMPPMPRGYGEPLNPSTSRRSMDQRAMNSINEFGFPDPMGPDTHLYLTQLPTYFARPSSILYHPPVYLDPSLATLPDSRHNTAPASSRNRRRRNQRRRNNDHLPAGPSKGKNNLKSNYRAARGARTRPSFVDDGPMVREKSARDGEWAGSQRVDADERSEIWNISGGRGGNGGRGGKIGGNGGTVNFHFH